MNIDNHINVVAGRPGAGKTLWAAREVVDCLRDENNIVLYIGFDQEFDRICRMVRAKYGNAPHGRLLFALQDGAGEAIGKSVDLANFQAQGFAMADPRARKRKAGNRWCSCFMTNAATTSSMADANCSKLLRRPAYMCMFCASDSVR